MRGPSMLPCGTPLYMSTGEDMDSFIMTCWDLSQQRKLFIHAITAVSMLKPFNVLISFGWLTVSKALDTSVYIICVSSFLESEVSHSKDAFSSWEDVDLPGINPNCWDVKRLFANRCCMILETKIDSSIREKLEVWFLRWPNDNSWGNSL